MSDASRSSLPFLPIVHPARLRRVKQPLYNRLMECLLLSMCNVADPSGYRLPPESAIVKHTGVSLITVKRALEELRKKGLVERRHGSGTYPLRKPTLADLLETVRPRRLAFYSRAQLHISVMLRYDVLYFLQRTLARQGADLLLIDHTVSPREIAGYELEGVFVSGQRRIPTGGLLPKLPAVFVGSSVPVGDTDGVFIDLDDAARKAVQFIQAADIRHLGFFGATGIERLVGRRLLTSLRARAERTLAIHSSCGGVEEVYQNARRWLERVEGRVCVFSAFYLCTGAVIRACESLGRRVGQDVLLLAYGAANTVLQDLVPMHILCPPRAQMAERALELMMLRMIAPQEPPRQVSLAVTLEKAA